MKTYDAIQDLRCEVARLNTVVYCMLLQMIAIGDFNQKGVEIWERENYEQFREDMAEKREEDKY